MGAGSQGPQGPQGPPGNTGPRGPPGPSGKLSWEQLNDEQRKDLIAGLKQFARDFKGPKGDKGDPGVVTIERDEDANKVARSISAIQSFRQNVADTILRDQTNFTEQIVSELEKDTRAPLRAELTNEIIKSPAIIDNLAETLTSKTEYVNALKGQDGSLGSETAIRLAIAPKTLWCADGDTCQLPTVKDGNVIKQKYFPDIIISKTKETTASGSTTKTYEESVNRWGIITDYKKGDEANEGRLRNLHIVPWGTYVEGSVNKDGFGAPNALMTFTNDPTKSTTTNDSKITMKAPVVMDKPVILNSYLTVGAQNITHPGNVGDGSIYRADGQMTIAVDDILRIRQRDSPNKIIDIRPDTSTINLGKWALNASDDHLRIYYNGTQLYTFQNDGKVNLRGPVYTNALYFKGSNGWWTFNSNNGPNDGVWLNKYSDVNESAGGWMDNTGRIGGTGIF